MNYSNTRAWRNNNPLNIRRGEKWTGLVAEPTDKEFCQFLTLDSSSLTSVIRS